MILQRMNDILLFDTYLLAKYVNARRLKNLADNRMMLACYNDTKRKLFTCIPKDIEQNRIDTTSLVLKDQCL
jgi:hypothetical protein